VRLEVIDNGHGIEESRLDRIFNPFYTTKPVGKGTGLGLSICYGIVQEHGGTIRVRSIPGRGATFTVELPVHESAPSAAPEPEVDRVALPSLRGRVLVVDDEEGMRTVICEALRTWGLQPVPAASGEQGLAILRGGDLRLAILDLRMPGLDGPGLYDRACAEGLELPPLLFSTGDAASDDARAFLERTGAPVLLKPFTLLSLREAIDGLLARELEPDPA
jgi:two-component system NtrC family sensor kinase